MTSTVPQDQDCSVLEDTCNRVKDTWKADRSTFRLVLSTMMDAVTHVFAKVEVQQFNT